MPGLLLHFNAAMTCFHAAKATIKPNQTRVLVSGQPIATIAESCHSHRPRDRLPVSSSGAERHQTAAMRHGEMDNAFDAFHRRRTTGSARARAWAGTGHLPKCRTNPARTANNSRSAITCGWKLNDMNINFPFKFDGRGQTAAANESQHIRQMIEQLIFTSPGERVNLPTFGSGVLQLIFAPNSPELAATVQFTMEAAVQQWLGDLIELENLEGCRRIPR